MNRLILLSFLFFLSLSCTNVPDNIDFLRSNGVMETQKVPLDFETDPSWELLGGNYVCSMRFLDQETEPKMIFLVADKKAKKLIGFYDVIDQLMPSAVAPGQSYTTMTNFGEISEEDKKRANDMAGLNAILKCIPELKNFSWKNEEQNRIVSGIILKTQFIAISKPKPDEKLFQPTSKQIETGHRKLIKELYEKGYALRQRSVERLNEVVVLNAYIEKLGFKFEEGNIVVDKKEKFTINDLLGNDPIDFKGKGKVFFFTPVKSYERPTEEGAEPMIEPAVQTFEFAFIPGTDNYPVFTRKTKVVSLLSPIASTNP